VKRAITKWKVKVMRLNWLLLRKQWSVQGSAASHRTRREAHFGSQEPGAFSWRIYSGPVPGVSKLPTQPNFGTIICHGDYSIILLDEKVESLNISIIIDSPLTGLSR